MPIRPESIRPESIRPESIRPESIRVVLAEDSNVLAHEAQYTLAEHERAVAFGHATVDYAMALAREAGVGRLMLSHHEPGRTDDDFESLARSLDSAALPVQAAVEGLELEV